MYTKELMKKIKNIIRGHSLFMLHYCTGCGAIELPPTMTSRFDMERLGISPMATPRQADILLITGYLSKKTLRRVIYTYEQMQSPKWVVGLGSCTINGGIYYDSYSTINELDLYLPVDLYLAGCMPRPEAIINGFKRLIEKIENNNADGWKHYRDNHKWYKKNQKHVLGDSLYTTR